MRAEPAVTMDFETARLAYYAEPRIAVDLETSGLSAWNDRAHVIALYGELSNTIAILHYPKGVEIPREHLDWLAGFPQVVWHNGTQFDALFLANHGFDWRRPALYDTLIGEQATLEVNRKDIRVNLADSVKRRLGKVLDKTIEHGRWGNQTLDEQQMAYVTGDISYILALQDKQLERSGDRGTRRCVEFEMELTKAVIDMELHGLPVDVNAIQRYFEGREAKFHEQDAYLRSVLGDILLSSFPQLTRALAERFGPRMFPDTKAERLMNVAQGEGEAARVAEALLGWRHYRQRQNMFGPEWQEKYVVPSPTGHRVHGKFWQLGTDTGRFSSTEPNLQQVPGDMKDCYGGHEGIVVGKADYAAIEVRVAAALADDPIMVAAFNDGEDIHRLVAAAGFDKAPEDVTKEERKIAKAMSFTLIFGGSVETFMDYARTNGSHIDRELAQAASDNFFRRFGGIGAMKASAIERTGRGRPITITYPTGLKRLLNGADLRPTVMLNNVVQGTASAGMKYALVELYERGLSPYLSAAVHDELVYSCPAGMIGELEREIAECMILGMHRALEGCPPIKIAVEASHGPTWKTDPATERKYEG